MKTTYNILLIKEAMLENFNVVKINALELIPQHSLNSIKYNLEKFDIFEQPFTKRDILDLLDLYGELNHIRHCILNAYENQSLERYSMALYHISVMKTTIFSVITEDM